MPCAASHSWNLSVPKGSKLTHPVGQPISHSTHLGFRGPPTASLRGLEFFAVVAGDAWWLFQSLAVGVGKRLRCAFHRCMLGLSMLRRVVGVGNKDPEALSAMGSTERGRGYNRPPSIEPERCQVGEDFAEILAPNKSRHIFQECVSGSNLPKHSPGLGPHVALVVLTPALAGLAEGSAWEARSDDIHDSTPRSTVKRSDVVPYGKGFQPALLLASKEDLPAVRIALNRTHGSMPEEDRAQNPSTSACEKFQHIHRGT